MIDDMSDELFDDIQHFLDDGGEPAEPTPQEQVIAALAAFAEAMRPMVEAIAEFVEKVREVFACLCRNYVDWTATIFIGLRRDQLRAKLESWRLPRPVAQWIANRWPVRWLPDLALAPP